MKGRGVLVFIYNSFADPLVQNLMLSYVKSVAPKIERPFILLTFEQRRFRLSTQEVQKHQSALKAVNIVWQPITYHSGKLILLKKAYDLFRATLCIIYWKFRYHLDSIFCFANVAGSMGYLIGRMLGLRVMVYSYEPHSDFMADLGVWSRRSLKFRLFHYLEWKVGENADVIMTGTQHMVDELKQRGSKAKLYRAPTAVDPNLFQFSASDRKKARQLWKVNDGQKVFLYVGKFGDLYYTHQIPKLFASIQSKIERAYFVTVTSNDHEEIDSLFSRYLKPENYFITGGLTYDELRSYLSGADFGISGVPPTPSQKYRSPTKVAEYMLHGLPYITTRGVSEDDAYAELTNVGVVVNCFGTIDDPSFYKKIKSLIDEEPKHKRQRIRSIGVKYRSMSRIDNILIEELT